jgi:hypothetical protein
MATNFDLFSAPTLPPLPKWGGFDMDGPSWTSFRLWAPGFWRFLSRDPSGLFGKFRAGHGTLSIESAWSWTTSFRLGSCLGHGTVWIRVWGHGPHPQPLPPQTHSGQCGSSQAGPGYEATKKDAITSFQLVRPATPVRKEVNYDYYDDDPSPRCKYRFVPDPYRGQGYTLCHTRGLA